MLRLGGDKHGISSTPVLIWQTPEIVFQDEGKERKPAEERNYGLTTKTAHRKEMEFAILCTDGELYLKALHPLFMMGIFLQGTMRRKLVSSAEKLGKHQGRPVSLFHTAGFSAAQVFFPLALGPSKDEC